MMTEFVKTPRRSASWIELFVEVNSTKPTPRIFRTWAAIATIAGALERRVWVRTADSILYPNLFTILVSPPGVGKSRIISEVDDLWRGVKRLHVAPKSITKAALVDCLNDSVRKEVLSATQLLEYHSLLVPSSEFGVLVPSHDLEFLNTLNDIYDCPKIYSERRRSLPEPINIPNPQLNILAGTQPAYLSSLFPETAFGMGFFSRIIMVYCGVPVKPPLFSTEVKGDPRQADLQKDLESMGSIYGEFRFTAAAASRISDWYDADCPPRPEHMKLLHYATRRILHALKLSMVAAISRSNALVIEDCDVVWALDTLIEAECAMPEIFREMGSSPDSQVLNDLYFYAWRQYMKDKRLLSEQRLINFLSDRTPANRIKDLLEIFVRNGMADRVEAAGVLMYKPKAKDDREVLA